LGSALQLPLLPWQQRQVTAAAAAAPAAAALSWASQEQNHCPTLQHLQLLLCVQSEMQGGCCQLQSLQQQHRQQQLQNQLQ
jgi:hypothetical protein